MPGIFTKNERENVCRLCRSILCCKKCRENHEINAHKINPKCDICVHGASYFSKITDDLIDHVTQEHWPLHCVLCGQSFASVYELNVHKKCRFAKGMLSTPQTDGGQALTTSTPMQRYYDNDFFQKKSEVVTPVDVPAKNEKEERDSFAADPCQKRRVTFSEVVQESDREDRRTSLDSYKTAVCSDYEDDPPSHGEESEAEVEPFMSCYEDNMWDPPGEPPQEADAGGVSPPTQPPYEIDDSSSRSRSPDYTEDVAAESATSTIHGASDATVFFCSKCGENVTHFCNDSQAESARHFDEILKNYRTGMLNRARMEQMQEMAAKFFMRNLMNLPFLRRDFFEENLPSVSSNPMSVVGFPRRYTQFESHFRWILEEMMRGMFPNPLEEIEWQQLREFAVSPIDSWGSPRILPSPSAYESEESRPESEARVPAEDTTIQSPEPERVDDEHVEEDERSRSSDQDTVECCIPEQKSPQVIDLTASDDENSSEPSNPSIIVDVSSSEDCPPSFWSSVTSTFQSIISTFTDMKDETSYGKKRLSSEANLSENDRVKRFKPTYITCRRPIRGVQPVIMMRFNPNAIREAASGEGSTEDKCCQTDF